MQRRMRGRGVAWGFEEDALLRQMFHDDLSDAEIAAHLPGRSEESIRLHRRNIGLTRRAARGGYGETSRFSGPSPQTLAERERAYSAPRSIGRELLGEPLPGRSYLDRKRESEAAQGERSNLSSRHPPWSPRAW